MNLDPMTESSRFPSIVVEGHLFLLTPSLKNQKERPSHISREKRNRECVYRRCGQFLNMGRHRWMERRHQKGWLNWVGLSLWANSSFVPLMPPREEGSNSTLPNSKQCWPCPAGGAPSPKCERSWQHKGFSLPKPRIPFQDLTGGFRSFQPEFL